MKATILLSIVLLVSLSSSLTLENTHQYGKHKSNKSKSTKKSDSKYGSLDYWQDWRSSSSGSKTDSKKYVQPVKYWDNDKSKTSSKHNATKQTYKSDSDSKVQKSKRHNSTTQYNGKKITHNTTESKFNQTKPAQISWKPHTLKPIKSASSKWRNSTKPSTKPSNHTKPSTKPTTKPSNHTKSSTKPSNHTKPSTKPSNHTKPSTKPTTKPSNHTKPTKTQKKQNKTKPLTPPGQQKKPTLNQTLAPQPTLSLPNPIKNLSNEGLKCLDKCKAQGGISCKKWDGNAITCCQFIGCQYPFACQKDKLIKVQGCQNKQ